jgi:hypothetical protein
MDENGNITAVYLKLPPVFLHPQMNELERQINT